MNIQLIGVLGIGSYSVNVVYNINKHYVDIGETENQNQTNLVQYFPLARISLLKFARHVEYVHQNLKLIF